MNTVGTIVLVLGLDRTNRLIGSGLSNCPSRLVKNKVKCCKSRDHFGCRVKNCTVPSITGHYPRLQVASAYFTALVDKKKKIKENEKNGRGEERR